MPVAPWCSVTYYLAGDLGGKEISQDKRFRSSRILRRRHRKNPEVSLTSAGVRPGKRRALNRVGDTLPFFLVSSAPYRENYLMLSTNPFLITLLGRRPEPSAAMTKRLPQRFENIFRGCWLLSLLVAAICLSLDVASGQPASSPGNDTKCRMNTDCPPPISRRGQDPRCLESACSKGVCVVRPRLGHALDGLVSGGEFSCFSAPVVCDAGGKASVVTENSRLVAIREGQHCIPAVTSNNPCQKPICRDKVCVHEPNDEAGCPDASISVTACQKRGCRNGACQAVPDPKKQGSACRDSETAACRTTTYTCSESGTCEAKKQVADVAECAADPLVLGAANRLPAAFKELVLTSATFPQYTCNVDTCKLEFCGDGVINRDEECDGTAMPPNAPAGRSCDFACRIAQ